MLAKVNDSLSRNPLLSLLRAPECEGAFTAREWEHIIATGREANLLGRLRWLLDNANTLGQIAEGPRRHLDSAWCSAETQRRALYREIAYLGDILRPATQQAVLLKGAAYTMAALPPAHGRQFSDIDILVPSRNLDKVEHDLNGAGWLGSHHDAYDQRYYREWMHELPPLHHPRRGSTLDIHHTILPETARFQPDASLLLAQAEELSGQPGIYVLAPTDMVIHSATHLFLEGEIPHGLRDLLDLDALLRFLGADERFWDKLPERARELDLGLPVYLAVHYCQRLLSTPVPHEALTKLADTAPPLLRLRLLDACYERVLLPSVVDNQGHLGRNMALWALFIRGHWLRMPVPLLLRHIAQKALIVPIMGDAPRARDR